MIRNTAAVVSPPIAAVLAFAQPDAELPSTNPATMATLT